MAAVEKGQVIIMAADGDAVTGLRRIQAMHATGAVAAIQNTDGDAICAFAGEDSISYPSNLKASGIKRGAGAGVLYVYLA